MHQMKHQIIFEELNCQFEDMSVKFHADWSTNVQTPVKNWEESKHRFLYFEMVPNLQVYTFKQAL